MRNLTLRNVVSVCGGSYHGDDALLDKEIQGAVLDSREVREGYLFFPTKGEHADGHDFIGDVFAKGALATMSERPLEHCLGPYIQVESSLEALGRLAAFYRRQLDIPIVGIIGSVGKTSTKEMVASVLSVRYRVLKTEGNFNNEIGLSLTLLRIREEHEAAVVEMGISDFGEMHRLGEMARPNICVITNIGDCHLEKLKDRDGVLRAKTEVFAHLAENAIVFLNGDDGKLCGLTDAGGRKPVFYGLHGQEIHMEEIEPLGLDGSRAKLCAPVGEVIVQVPIPGRHNLYNAMAAAGVGLALGLTLVEVKKGIEGARTIAGRSNRLEAGPITILDDCYNANPMSMMASLEVLSFAPKRKVAILGDMGELGAEERRLHREVGACAANYGIDLLVCVGTLAAEIARGAEEAVGNARDTDAMRGVVKAASDAQDDMDNAKDTTQDIAKAASDVQDAVDNVKGNGCGQVLYFQGKPELLAELPNLVEAGDTVLVKASHFMQFAEIVEALRKLGESQSR